jgi:OOP family OmpA-OmpF porin
MKARVLIFAVCLAAANVLTAVGAQAKLNFEALHPPLPLTIVGWFAFDPDSSEGMDPTGIAFSNALYFGYSELSKERRAAPDPKDGEYFNHKARTAARRSVVLPDWPSDRHLKDEDAAVFHSALNTMNTAFERGGREVAPQEAANAQVSYDCWIEATEWQRVDDIERCRQAFWDAMKAVSDAADYQLTDAQFQPQMAPQAAAVAVALEGYLVYFEWNSTAVTPAGQAALQESIRAAEANPQTSINLVGHADRSGPEGYNQGLSERRALVVIQTMTEAGIPRARISWNAVGETQPLVPTADGVREQGNRVVEVDLM